MSNPYQSAGGSLKLKGVSDLGIKKKKKKSKKFQKFKEQVPTVQDSTDEAPSALKRDRRTPAEIAFERVQEKRKAQRILEKAQKKHKERVEEFNQNLDKLSEHYDIPKVSWTK
ncbi:protein FAM32A-like [Anneissia japonica]|uniref:protein FAM32A-like n=1 Tax=Anneissia japonica TaxID=1529436 RepID=UPI0014257C86|nr:protein FAM32A-like [Anneissia japonica]